MNDNSLLTEVFEKHSELIDLRAPIEFSAGSLPGAVNLPILDDDERANVGKTYKIKGKEAALSLGFKLVSGTKREERISLWREYLSNKSAPLIFCYRGGKRSEIAQSWLGESGVYVDRIECGYKGIRAELLSVFEKEHSLMLLGGKTGVGKTKILSEFHQSIDLELLANHRGSAFGRHLNEQPTQGKFENELAVELYKKRGLQKIIIEDEGKLIGRISIPKPFQKTMASSPLIVIEANLDLRVQNIWEEYILEQSANYEKSFGSEGIEKFSEYLVLSNYKIKKKLGNQLHEEIEKKIMKAFREKKPELHKDWIKIVLERYYDPMYEYQLAKKIDRLNFSGTSSEVRAWITAFFEN